MANESIYYMVSCMLTEHVIANQLYRPRYVIPLENYLFPSITAILQCNHVVDQLDQLMTW